MTWIADGGRRSEIGAPQNAESLLARVADGDRGALGALYDQLGGAVYAMARRMLRDPTSAERVVHAVFVEIWREAPHREPHEDAVHLWVAAIVRRECVDVLRGRAPHSAA